MASLATPAVRAAGSGAAEAAGPARPLKRRRLFNFGRRRPGRDRFGRGFLSQRGRSGFATHTFTLRFASVLMTDGAGNCATQFSVANPTTAINGAGTYEDWTAVQSLFDIYKVKQISVKFFPNRPTDPSGTTVYRPVALCYDPDSTGTQTYSSIIAYENCAVRDLNKPWIYTVMWPSMQTGITGATTGWLDVANPQTIGSIALTNVSPLTASSQYGNFVLEMTILMRGRR